MVPHRPFPSICIGSQPFSISSVEFVLDFQADTYHSFLWLVIFPILSILILSPFLFHEYALQLTFTLEFLGRSFIIREVSLLQAKEGKHFCGDQSDLDTPPFADALLGLVENSRNHALVRAFDLVYNKVYSHYVFVFWILESFHNCNILFLNICTHCNSFLKLVLKIFSEGTNIVNELLEKTFLARYRTTEASKVRVAARQR